MDAFNEVSPPGWSGTVKAMLLKHPEIDNPYALAWSMHNKGDRPHYRPMPEDSTLKPGTPKKKRGEGKKHKHKHKKTEATLGGFRQWMEEQGLI